MKTFEKILSGALVLRLGLLTAICRMLLIGGGKKIRRVSCEK